MEEENEEIKFLQQFKDLEFSFEKRKESSRSRPAGKRTFWKEIVLVAFSATTVMLVFYTLFSILGFYQNSRTIIQAKAATQPFFSQMHRQLVEDNFDGTIKVARHPKISLQMFYSPYSITSKHFRAKYYQVARNLKIQHPKTSPYFGAVNCFDSGGSCRKKYRIDKYPVLMATDPRQVSSVYNGPLDAVYVTRWMNRLQNSVVRISFPEQMVALAKRYDLVVVTFIRFKSATSPTFLNFTSSAFQYYDGDPNSESAIFCVVTDSLLAADFQLFNENDVVFIDSDLRAIFTQTSQPWTIEELVNGVKHFAGNERRKSLEVLSLGSRNLASTQLSEKINSSSVFLYVTKNIHYGDTKFELLKEVARKYYTCDSETDPHKYLLSGDVDVEKFELPSVDCTSDLKSYSCERNSTLSFMVMDSEIDVQLATKFGADKEDVIIAINGQEEDTKFIRGNITQDMIHCLIRQHHEAAENKFVVESSKLGQKQHIDIIYEEDSGQIGEKNRIQRFDNVSHLIGNEKNLVVLFSGGVWHAASASVISVLHQTADFFSEVKHLIDFVIVDVTKTNIPYNFDFEKLPKILVTGAKSTGTSWSYPEELPINFPNLLKFITTRPSFRLRALTLLASCGEKCKRRSQWSLRRERTRLKLAMNRHSSINPRQRVRIGYINRVLGMLL